MTDYNFIVNLSSGNTTPEYNVYGGKHFIPVNTMPAPLYEGDTFTFSFHMGPLHEPQNSVHNFQWKLSSCTFYCWPNVSENGRSPFYSESLRIENKINILNNPKITIKPDKADPSVGITLWSFALNGICSISSFEIPFFIDPEGYCSSGA